QVRHAGRSLLVVRREDLALFDARFGRFFSRHWGERPARSQKAPRAPRHDEPREKPFTIVNYMAYKAKHIDREVDVTDRSGTFTDVELLQRKDFSRLTPEELRAVRRLIGDMRWRASLRQTRRRQPSRRGDLLDLRATLRRASRHGGAVVGLERAERRFKQRPIVVLADISGSMEKLSRLVLQFFYSLTRGLGDVEAFLFGTRLTRVTEPLRLRNIDQAISGAARAAQDWSGGTRIGLNLHAFERSYARRVLRRGALLIIISDGWERGSTAPLEGAMRRLHGRCHRLIWLNPLAGSADYRPLAGGMAAALPYVDDFLPVHNLQSLDALSDHLASLPSRRSGVRGLRRGAASSGPAPARGIDSGGPAPSFQHVDRPRHADG
ncbi:MAG: VWA domain-containing protein, partial [Acidobacteriota bacterium]